MFHLNPLNGGKEILVYIAGYNYIVKLYFKMKVSANQVN